MEHIISNNIYDITYMSELIPPSFALRSKAGGINSPKQLTFASFRKLWAH